MLCETISNVYDYNTNRAPLYLGTNFCAFSFSKNQYAEVVLVRQLVDEVVEAYSQAIQVCSLLWL